MSSPVVRTALAVVATALIVTLVILTSYTPATSTTTSISKVTSMVTSTAIVTVTEVVSYDSTVTLSVTPSGPYAFVINSNATVTGNAVSILGCAVHGGCTSAPDQSATAMLILYEGDYYYVSNYTITGSYNIVYTVWYTNSTEYCVSPQLSGIPICPNAIFVQAEPTHTQTTTSTMSSLTTSSSCTVSAQGGPVFVEVETDEGAPVTNQQLQVTQISPCGSANLPALFTNSTGWVEVPQDENLPYAGSFTITFVYSDQDYNETISILPETTTYITIYVPSGQTYTLNCPNSYCQTDSMSMSMGG